MAWNPWLALRQRPHLHLFWMELPDGTDGMYVPNGSGAAIVLDPRLDRPGRNAVLAHELIHDEWGGGCRHHDGVIRAREERRVDGEVAARLVPPDDLWEFCQGMADIHLGVGPAEVAEQFDVPEWVAQIALQRLADSHHRDVG